MSAFLTYCGIYCAVCAAVGLYFYLVLAAMEYNQNQALKYVWNVDKGSITGEKTDAEMTAEGHAIDMSMKGTAFLILALIQAILLVSCALCGTLSMRADAAAEEDDLKKKRAQQYESLGQDDGMENNNQIMS